MRNSLSRNVVSILVFIGLLILLNLLLNSLDTGIHISLIGSVALTLIVWFVMGAISKASERKH